MIKVYSFVCLYKCDQIWQNFPHFGQFLNQWQFFRVDLVFGEQFDLLWQICYAVGQTDTIDAVLLSWQRLEAFQSQNEHLNGLPKRQEFDLVACWLDCRPRWAVLWKPWRWQRHCRSATCRDSRKSQQRNSPRSSFSIRPEMRNDLRCRWRKNRRQWIPMQGR